MVIQTKKCLKKEEIDLPIKSVKKEVCVQAIKLKQKSVIVLNPLS